MGGQTIGERGVLGGTERQARRQPFAAQRSAKSRTIGIVFGRRWQGVHVLRLK
jgi:hypothetical protein